MNQKANTKSCSAALRSAAACCVLLTLIAATGCPQHEETGKMTDAASTTPGSTSAHSTEAQVQTEKATFAAGCFWGVEATFRSVPGVVDTRVGYTGGHTDEPTYHDVCSGNTGHAEAVEVTFDPARVSYDKLLDAFWDCHDPTTPNRQGPDVGSQYRSAVFFHSDAQREAATASRGRLVESGKLRRAVVTEITAAGTFYPAEEYHQQYLEKRGQSTCGTGH